MATTDVPVTIGLVVCWLAPEAIFPSKEVGALAIWELY